VARAAIQRIPDLVAGEQVARLAMNLLRRRIAEVKVLGAQNRRVLHDEVLPQLHAAILRLEACGDAEAMAALTGAHKTLSAMVRQMARLNLRDWSAKGWSSRCAVRWSMTFAMLLKASSGAWTNRPLCVSRETCRRLSARLSLRRRKKRFATPPVTGVEATARDLCASRSRQFGQAVCVWLSKTMG